MYCAILAIAVLNLCAAENSSSNHIATQDRIISNVAAKRLHNMTYLDKEENMLKMPVLNNHFEEHQKKQKKKKSPKSIIQKIIKKRKTKLRKVYFNQATKRSTLKPVVMYEYDKKWANKDIQNRETTTHPTHKRRSKNSNVNYYHMPFQKMQKKNERRHKRGLSKELTVLKEFDQVQFLSKEKDSDIYYGTATNSMTPFIE